MFSCDWCTSSIISKTITQHSPEYIDNYFCNIQNCLRPEHTAKYINHSNSKVEGVNAFLNEGKFTTLNKFKEEFHQQRQTITKIMSINFQIVMEVIKKSHHQIKEIEHENTELKNSVDFIESVLKKK